jgi:hypothetical protein
MPVPTIGAVQVLAGVRTRKTRAGPAPKLLAIVLDARRAQAGETVLVDRVLPA